MIHTIIMQNADTLITKELGRYLNKIYSNQHFYPVIKIFSLKQWIIQPPVAATSYSHKIYLIFFENVLFVFMNV